MKERKNEKGRKEGGGGKEIIDFITKTLLPLPLNGYSLVAMEMSLLPSNQPCVRSLRENLVLYLSEAGTVVETPANSSSLPPSLSHTLMP